MEAEGSQEEGSGNGEQRTLRGCRFELVLFELLYISYYRLGFVYIKSKSEPPSSNASPPYAPRSWVFFALLVPTCFGFEAAAGLTLLPPLLFASFSAFVLSSAHVLTEVESFRASTSRMGSMSCLVRAGTKCFEYPAASREV